VTNINSSDLDEAIEQGGGKIIRGAEDVAAIISAVAINGGVIMLP